MLRMNEMFNVVNGNADYQRLVDLAHRYYAPTTGDRLFKVPVDAATEFGKLVKQFKLPGVRLVRRAGGGPRFDALKATCLVRHAKYFNYYRREKNRRYGVPLRVDPKESNTELLEICGLYQSPLDRVEQIINDYDISLVDATWLRSLALNNG